MKIQISKFRAILSGRNVGIGSWVGTGYGNWWIGLGMKHWDILRGWDMELEPRLWLRNFTKFFLDTIEEIELKLLYSYPGFCHCWGTVYSDTQCFSRHSRCSHLVVSVDCSCSLGLGLRLLSPCCLCSIGCFEERSTDNRQGTSSSWHLLKQNIVNHCISFVIMATESEISFKIELNKDSSTLINRDKYQFR